MSAPRLTGPPLRTKLLDPAGNITLPWMIWLNQTATEIGNAESAAAIDVYSDAGHDSQPQIEQAVRLLADGSATGQGLADISELATRLALVAEYNGQVIADVAEIKTAIAALTLGYQNEAAGALADHDARLALIADNPDRRNFGESVVISAPNVPLTVGNPSATQYADIAFSGTGRLWAAGVGNASEATYNVASKFFIFDSGANAMRLVIDTAGNVGIGTAAPGAALDVAGTINGTALSIASAILSPVMTSAVASGAVSINCNTGPSFNLNLQAASTLTITNPKAGMVYHLLLTQGGVGSFTMTWPATVKWSGGVAPTLTTAAGKKDRFELLYDGAAFYTSFWLNY